MTLRPPRTWVLVAVTAVLTALLFVGGPEGDWPRSLRNAWDLGHVVLFGAAACLALRTPLRHRPLLWQAVALFLGAALLGLATEWLQAANHRDASWSDVERDLVGAALPLAFVSPRMVALARWKRTVFRLAVAAAVAWVVAPTVHALLDEARARRDFPMLGDFENAAEQGRWDGQAARRITQEQARSGAHSLRVDLGTDTYSGVALRYFPADWSAYATLAFSVFNPSGDSLALVCKVNDREHRLHGYEYRDRFNRKITVLPGWNDYAVSLAEVRSAPENRQMDLRQVSTLQLFATRLEEPRTIYLDRVHLR